MTDAANFLFTEFLYFSSSICNCFVCNVNSAACRSALLEFVNGTIKSQIDVSCTRTRKNLIGKTSSNENNRTSFMILNCLQSDLAPSLFEDRRNARYRKMNDQ